MNELENNRLVRTFAGLRADGRKTLLPFLTAGYPSIEATAAILREIEARGTKICELGVPFSDPIADGPTIQASYTAALDGGVTTARIFEMVRDYRGAGGSMAVLAMVSYSIVFRRSCDAFIRQAAQAGFDGLIVPDLPLDEAAGMAEMAASAGLCNVLLISPTTLPQRREQIARACTGFVYYMSVAGITGERTQLPQATIQGVVQLRQAVGTPICVGFGISSAEMVRTVCEVADGAIVGSAIIHRVTDHLDRPVDELARIVGDFVTELLSPLA